MADDIFSRLFDLFDQPGPINWKLAAEVAHHVSGERQPVEPWAAEEFRDLARLAEYRVDEVAPFRINPAMDVLPLDRRTWADKNLEKYGSLAEPFGSSLGDSEGGMPILGQMGPAIVGLQVGSLVGSLSTWVVASFDAGLPQQNIGAMSLIVDNIVDLDVGDIDRREVHLWVVANEIAFRATSQLSWIQDHLNELVANYAESAKIDPSQLSGLMMGGTDPESVQRAIDQAGGIESLLGGEEAEVPRAELEAFLGAITGCSRLLARRAVGEMAPSFDRISQARDQTRLVISEQPAIGVGPVPVEATQLGDEFNQEVERRYGQDALATLWSDPTRMPTAEELRDPTAWAARVLLDGWN